MSLKAGGPPSALRPAPARDHGTPPQGFVNPPLLPLAGPVVEAATIAAEAAGVVVLAPIALILALILGTATPAGGPGLPHPALPLPNPDEQRLHELATKHAAGTLTAGEEAELVALLAKVRGIHVQKLSDLDVKGPLRGNQQLLPGFDYVPLTYTKRSTADLAALRSRFSSVRKKFMKKLVTDPASLAQLRTAGISEAEIARAAKGGVPDGWQVHHKLPLDDGGNNAFDNLMLIKNDPYHLAITNLQNQLTNNLGEGQSLPVQWSMFNGIVYPPTPQR